MGEMKPLGSEKLTGNDKINRILELTFYDNQNDSTSKPRVAEFVTESNSGVYGIVKEKDGYYVKKGLNESSLDYIGGMFMKNKNRFSSYSEAYKKLEFLKGQEMLQEDVKYVLKQKPVSNDNPMPAPPPPPAENTPAPDMGTPPPDENAPAPDMGGEPLNTPMDGEGDQEGDVGEDADYLKVVQKLTGRLEQKLNIFKDKLEKEDIKYVLNSIISNLDLDKLEDQDKEEIIDNIEGEDKEDEFSGEGDPTDDSELPVPTADEAEPNDLGEEDEDPMDTLENLINSDFEDYEGSNEFNEPAPEQSGSCDWCGYKHGHAKGCPNAEEEVHDFPTDVTDVDEDFSEFGDDDFKTEEDDDSIFDKLNFDDEPTEHNRKEFDIDEITNMINQSVKEKLGKYFE